LGEQNRCLDGFLFVTPEYDHSITAALKNVLDTAKVEWYNQLQVADVRTHPALHLLTGFDHYAKWQSL